MNLSIVIPVLNEFRLEWTVNRIKKVCDGDLPEIVLVFDGDDPKNYCVDYPNLKVVVNSEILGTGPSRHIGILHASNDAIFTTDSHVYIESDTFFSDMLRLIKRYPNDILCCKLRTLSSKRMYFTKGEAQYTGANLALRVNEKAGVNILAAKWGTHDFGIIPCIMGACYGLRRSRYVKDLAQPLSVNQGWGHDEETLSLVNWICGGESRLVDLEIGHPFGEARPQTDREISSGGIKTWANRTSMVDYLPMSEGLRSILREWSFKSRYVSAHRDSIFGITKHKKVKQLRDHLRTQDRTFDDYIRRFKCKDLIKDELADFPLSSGLFAECLFDTDKKIECDRHIAIAAWSRSGSHCIADWVCYQMEGHVRYKSGLNLTRHRRNDPKGFIKGDTRLPTANVTGVGGKKTFVASLERFDPSMEILVPWIDADEVKSVIVVRNPFNWLASLKSHGTGFFQANGPVRLLKMWCEYAEASLSPTKCIPLYYDRFISSEKYRDYIASEIGVDNRSDASLSQVCSIGRGSSFDGVLLDGQAGKMDTDKRWENYKSEQWMIDAMNNVRVSYLLSELELQAIHAEKEYVDKSY